MSSRTLTCLPALLLLLACGGDDPPTEITPTGETGTNSTTTPTGENEWGARCGDGLPDCPDGQACFTPPVPDGSTTEGYCSPTCAVDSDCTDGFFGPGRALCFAPPSCLIDCDRAYADGACPEGLTCLSTGGPTNACGVPAQ